MLAKRRSSLPRWVVITLALILGWSIVTRLYRLEQPRIYIFDEVYHAVTAKLILHNDPRAFEWWNPPPEPSTAVDWLHPPLAKYTQALSMGVFGENSYGWRFSSALVGTLVILLVFSLALTVFGKHRLALLAALLSSLDGLLLVQSRIAMNDIHVTAAILAALIAYWRARQEPRSLWLLVAGLLGGVAMGSKWSGLFVVIYMGLWVAWDMVNAISQRTFGVWLQRVPWIVFCLVVLPLVVYVASYGQMFMQGKGYAHFRELHQQIWWYQTNLTATHPYQSRPWQWFFDLRPVWYHVEYFTGSTIANVYALGNPLLFWLGGAAAVITAGVGLLTLTDALRGIRNKKIMSTKELEQLFYIAGAYAIVWMPWQISPRIMFFYHYTPAAALLSILLAYWLDKAWPEYRSTVIGVLSLVFVVFILWYPQWTAIPVPTWWAESVYFALSSWK